MAIEKGISNQQAVELLNEYKKTRNQRTLAQFYKPYMRMVLAIGLRYFQDKMLAEDLVIDVYEILLAKAHNHHVTNVSSWVYSIAKNECLMTLRKQKREFSADEEKFQNYFVESEQILHLFNENEKEKEFHTLENCIELLKSEQKQCIQEFYLKQKTYKQIAEEQTLDLKKVKSLIQNGKRNLKNCMENKK